jgi:hypothetical protein
MSSHAGDERHWQRGSRRAILSPPPQTAWRQLMLAAAWFTFLRSEAKA